MDISLSLYKLSDALGIPLQYKNGTVTGQGSAVFSPLPKMSLPVTIKAKKLFANEAVGVLAHIVGDLNMLVTHYSRTGTVSVFLIDGALFKADPEDAPEQYFTSTNTMKQAVANLRKGIVASFLFKDRRWSVLKLPA